ncbi:MAG: hypothetical protein JJU28_13835 [Cyclobacteriaceae bacterium]|nr:hypothetical protein [Cyclobacteriaceae bacterium]
MKELKLFIVEDDPNVVEGYESSIKSFNKTNEHNIQITPIYEGNKDAALIRLKDSDISFDGAIVDLDLRQSGGEDSSGNEIIKAVVENLRFPVFVISGTAHNLDPELNKESSFFKVRNRDEGFDFIEEMISIYNTGITRILNRKGTIEKYITDIFWNHLSNSMDLWITDRVRSPEQKEKSLLRYTLFHIQEHLELTAESDFENYHPAEIYITPPVKDKVFTGDILIEKESKKNFIVLTPSCDLAHEGKTENILIGEIVKSDSGEINDLKMIINGNNVGRDRKNNAANKLKNLIKNNVPKYHFLPKYKEISGGLIDFQSLKSINKDTLNDFERIACVNSTFTKDIIARFSFYYSRQGSPDFNIDEVYESLINA